MCSLSLPPGRVLGGSRGHTNAKAKQFMTTQNTTEKAEHTAEFVQEYDCMRCEETFTATVASDYCPKCSRNMNRTDMQRQSAKAEFAHEDEVATLRALREFDRKNIEKLKQDKADLLAAAKAWESARNDGGISMADLYEAAWQKTQTAIARAEGRQP